MDLNSDSTSGTCEPQYFQVDTLAGLLGALKGDERHVLMMVGQKVRGSWISADRQAVIPTQDTCLQIFFFTWETTLYLYKPSLIGFVFYATEPNPDTEVQAGLQVGEKSA